jgi:peptidoglycan/xylan/chitin deacetylase (PgdA/CDA1 family)
VRKKPPRKELKRETLVVAFVHNFYITFDVEDFINPRSLDALQHILKLLKKNCVIALFFITGHMAEKICQNQEVLNLLEPHEIGFHSTSHSVHPNIFEYTDVNEYQKAYQISISREVSQIDPLTGEIKGKGGFKLLRDMFPHKEVEAFRAPGFSWSPPHLEALKSLGIKYDFSTNLCRTSTSYKRITFFPFPSIIDTLDLSYLLYSALKEKTTVIDLHPDTFVNRVYWDSPYFHCNPKENLVVPQRTLEQTEELFSKLDSLLHMVRYLMKLKIFDTSSIEESKTELDTRMINIERIYNKMTLWPTSRFIYRPTFIRSHLLKFLDLDDKK